VAAGAIGVLLELAGARSVVVSVLVLVFIVVAPTAAIAGLLRGFDVFARIILAAVTAVAVVTLIAMIMLAIGAWSVKGGLVAIALFSAACLLAQPGRAAWLMSFPGMKRLRENRISGWITRVSGRLAALMAGLAAGRRRAAAENQGAATAGEATSRPEPECASPGQPGRSGPGDSAPGPQSPRLGSPSVIRPASQPDSEAKQI
jgi:hypothetical protein